MSQSSDIIIIGGGIVGLATAYHLSTHHPTRSIIVLEKEAAVARHQTGRNSGVMHSGIYYKPGSMRAKNCRAGLKAMKEFCAREGIRHHVCGKVIVATHASQLERLQNLFERGRANGVQCELIDNSRLREIEPHCAGIQAIHLPEAGIVNYGDVARRLAEIIESRNHRVVMNARVTALREGLDETVIESTAGEFRSRWLVNCAGLHSDRVTALSGIKPSAQILPFRGEYFKLRPEAERLCRGLIYPVPDPQFPFLDVHFTRLAHGGVECGPNAVLAWAREGYRKTDIHLGDLWEAVSYSGFRKLAARHWRKGLEEFWRSCSKPAFLRAAQRLVPAVRDEDLSPAPAGVRAQAVSPDGKIVDDFALETTKRIVNVINAPSPAATASLSVGEMVARTLAERF